jgi:predicted phosphate transport protein (TIGR00153 family)
MNIDKFLKFFVPKDHSFYPLFEEDASNLVLATELLREQLSSTDPEVHEKIYKQIKQLEHVGDEIADRSFIALNKSFITPFDREDIHELTSRIDDVVDSIDGVGRRICLYKPRRLMPVYKQMADLINEAALEIKTCIHYLNDACNKVKEIEHKTDDFYYVAVQELFAKETDPTEIFKNNKILEILERCVDEEEDVTDTIRSILIKMA